MSSEKELHLIGNDLRWSDLGAVGMSSASNSGIIATQDNVFDGIIQTLLLYGSLGVIGNTIAYSLAGNVSTGAKKYSWICPFQVGATIRSCYAGVGTAPLTTGILIDINIDGTTIFTNQSNRITITAGETLGIGGAQVTAIPFGGIVTIDIDQIGTGTVGADLSVVILIDPLAALA